MSSQEVNRIISKLREKTQSLEYSDKDKKKIDKKAVWALAKKISKRLRDDSLSAPNSARA